MAVGTHRTPASDSPRGKGKDGVPSGTPIASTYSYRSLRNTFSIADTSSSPSSQPGGWLDL